MKQPDYSLHVNGAGSIPSNGDARKDAIPPYGGALIDRVVNGGTADKLRAQSIDWPSWDLTPRQLCDLELLLNGGFSPLQGFLAQPEYDRVCREMRLTGGTLWPLPVILDVSEAFAHKIGAGSKVALRDPEGVMLAVLTVQDLWRPDRVAEAELVYGTADTHHAGVKFLLDHIGPAYVGGKVEGLQLPHHHDFQYLRHTPGQLREKFRRLGWNQVIAFQTRNPMHRAHFEMTLQAAKERGANLLLHPVTGMTKPGDVDHFCRVRCYQALLPRYSENLAALSLLPLSMRMAGPREAVWHAIIQRNYGCSHLIVGRDHAGPGNGGNDRPFYDPFAAHELLLKHETELGIGAVTFSRMVYSPIRKEYLSDTRIPAGAKTMDLSGTELRDRLANGSEIPEWFTFPEVAAELRKTYPPRAQQGFTIFFTGLSGSGKSTLAKALLDKLLEIGGRPVTLLDGDVVRKNLSSELGFSRHHRNLNILRIGFVANEITKNGGVAICAPIAPYDDIRQEVRKLISSRGGFILVHLSTPLEICEQRDRKGLYAKARAGIVKEFTGVSDPYETPADAEVVLNTAELSVEDACQVILNHLHTERYLTIPNQFAGLGLLPITRHAPAKRHGPSLGHAVRRRLLPLDGEALCAQARRRAGWDDFGNPPIEPALSILVNSLEQEAELHSLGRFLIRSHLSGLLQTRLQLAEAWNRQQETLGAIQRPVFITGMPRSGSTFLHELLAEDPTVRVPRAWELMFPVPPAEGRSGSDLRVWKAEASLWCFRRLAPRADSVHPIRALTPHECVAIHSYTMLSEEFISTCRIPSYETFLHNTDLLPVYAWQRRFLQHLQFPDRATQWVLKAPDHVRGLAALFKAFPDAVVVQTHRNPLEVLKSLTQLIEVLHGLFSKPGDRNEIGLREARMLADGMERSIHFRENHPELADRFIDVNYSELVSDPLPVVRRVYEQLEIPFADLALRRMRDFALNRSRYTGQRRRSTLSDWGLDPQKEARRFERYCSRFAIDWQSTQTA